MWFTVLKCLFRTVLMLLVVNQIVFEVNENVIQCSRSVKHYLCSVTWRSRTKILLLLQIDHHLIYLSHNMEMFILLFKIQPRGNIFCFYQHSENLF